MMARSLLVSQSVVGLLLLLRGAAAVAITQSGVSTKLVAPRSLLVVGVWPPQQTPPQQTPLPPPVLLAGGALAAAVARRAASRNPARAPRDQRCHHNDDDGELLMPRAGRQAHAQGMFAFLPLQAVRCRPRQEQARCSS